MDKPLSIELLKQLGFSVVLNRKGEFDYCFLPNAAQNCLPDFEFYHLPSLFEILSVAKQYGINQEKERILSKFRDEIG